MRGVCTGLLLMGGIGLGYGVQQHTFGWIALYFGLAFLGYFGWLLSEKGRSSWRFGLGLALILRLLLVFTMPALSDDVYRFIWDGRLLANGLNPFSALPSDIMSSGTNIPGMTPELFAELNSPNYYTIYPPFAQGTFWLAAYLSFSSVWGSTLVLKLILLVCEALGLWAMLRLLRKWNLPEHRVLIYALNPLVIVEVVGNLHYEGAMVAFFMWALVFLSYGQGTEKKWGQAAFLWALSIVSKLLTLLFLPFLWSRLRKKTALLFYAGVLLLVALSFAPLLNSSFVNGFGESLDLYFRKFEFNASFYYLIRWIGYQWVGYNVIQTVGPKLGLLAVAAIGIGGLLDKKTDWPSLMQRCLWAIMAYLLLATTVHPWYAILPLALSVFTRYRFPLVWTALIWLTYINYSYPIYRENLWVVGLEYVVVVGWMGWELWSGSRQISVRENQVS
jgi:hypothetical protein